jgi:RNA binding exosome subunit
MRNIISMSNIVTATEKAEKIHPIISETIGSAIEKIR